MKAIRKNGREEENQKESERRDFKNDTHHDENNHNDDHQSDNDNNETDEYFNYHSLWLSNVRVQCLIMTSSPNSSKQERYHQRGIDKKERETGKEKQEEIIGKVDMKSKSGDKKKEKDRGVEVEKEVEADWSEALDGTFAHWKRLHL